MITHHWGAGTYETYKQPVEEWTKTQQALAEEVGGFGEASGVAEKEHEAASDRPERERRPYPGRPLVPLKPSRSHRRKKASQC
jgi:hypothetical protein